jgi:ATP-dependent helicase/nuclease subunit A
LSAAEIGSATHRFLELVSLDATSSLAALRGEAQRLRAARRLTADEFAALDVAAIAAFWDSAVGRRVRTRATDVRRELPFTARFTPADLAAVGVPAEPGLAADEFIVVQGIADLVVVGAAELWLLDFKTDAVGRGEMAGKVEAYRPQLGLYALALSRIYQRPVTERWLHFLSLNQTVGV